MVQTGKITALYCRFSADDMRGESDSIAHQKAILTDYANNHGLTNQRYYVDDGVSGTTFERDGFKEMLRDIENGIVGTVVVKDMSRFGRNYLMVGQYLELVFPEYGVRFIAISDNVDSAEGMSDMIPFSNIMNEWYARDISRKERAVIQNRGNNGGRTTNLAVYGYRKDPNDKTKWLVDETAAIIVKRIFDMYVNGTGILEISRVLTAEKIPRPTAHMKFKTGVRCDDFEEYFWHPSSVRNILRRQEYCGDTVNFRTTRLSYKSHKIVWNPKEKLKIFENTHEAIISREVYERAQEMLGEPRKVPRTGERALYYDYLYCEECKHTMRIRNRAANADQKSYFCTLAHKKRGACDLHNIAEVVLNDYVMGQINKLLVFAKTDRDGFEKMMKDKCDGSILAESETTEARIEQIKARLSEIDVYVQGLFESKIRGEIDGDMFCTFSEKYRTEKSELNTELENLFLTLQNIKKKTNKSAVLGTSVNKYDTISEVTSEVLRDFIEHIEVGEYTGERKFRKKVRKIRIFFIGIGEVHFD